MSHECKYHEECMTNARKYTASVRSGYCALYLDEIHSKHVLMRINTAESSCLMRRKGNLT